MTRWQCENCGTSFHVGLVSRCPGCTSVRGRVVLPAVAPITEPEEVASSPGNSSPTSPAKPRKSAAPQKGAARKRARATGNPSKKRGGSSTAGSAGGRSKGT